MILPILRMVKQVMPSAMVWVFSAGETQNGKSTHDAENVVYITSDILQARYNALHHREYEIALDEWRDYKNTGNKILGSSTPLGMKYYRTCSPMNSMSPMIMLREGKKL